MILSSHNNKSNQKLNRKPITQIETWNIKRREMSINKSQRKSNVRLSNSTDMQLDLLALLAPKDNYRFKL